MTIILINELTANHLDQVLFIYNHEIVNSTSLFLLTPVDRSNREVWLQGLQERDRPRIVAQSEQDGEVLGFACADTWRNFAAYDKTLELAIYVHPHHRRKGIGRILLLRLIQIAKEKSYKVLIAAIEASNVASIRLCCQVGQFDQVGVFSQVGFKFGQWLDVVFLQKLLN